MATQQDTRLNGAEPDAGINNVDDTQGAAVTDQYSGLDIAAPVEGAPEVTSEPPQEPTTITPEPILTDDGLTQRDRELKQREDEFKQLEEHTHIQQAVLGYYEQQVASNSQVFENDGLDPEQAKKYGEAFSRVEASLANAQYVSKILAEKLISAQEGIPRDLLRGVWDEGSMRDLATQHKRMGGPERQELESLQRDFNTLKDQVRKGTVPAQNFNQSGGSGAGSGGDAEINSRFARGLIPWSPAVQQARQRLFGS